MKEPIIWSMLKVWSWKEWKKAMIDKNTQKSKKLVLTIVLLEKNLVGKKYTAKHISFITFDCK